MFYDEIYLVDIQTGDFIIETVKENETIVDIEFDPYRKSIYCTFEYSGEIYKLHGITGTFQKLIKTTGPVNSLVFIPVNRNIYAHMILDYASDRKWNEELISYNPDKEELSIIYVEQKEGPRDFIHAFITDLIMDADSNKIYLTNGQSNIKIVQCADDQLVLQLRTWNWISFPRLARAGNDPVSSQEQLENIDPFPTYLQLKHFLAYFDQTIDKTYLDPIWSGELLAVHSTLGYKLETNNQALSTLPITETVLDPGTTMPLYGFKTNWAGYYLVAIQSPFEAIGEEFLEKINQINGQYWSCHHIGSPQTKSSAGSL